MTCRKEMLTTEEKAEDRQDTSDISEFGLSIACLFLSAFFIIFARYLGPESDFNIRSITVPIDAIVSWGFSILAIVLFVFFLGFWGVAMRNNPEMGRFFKTLWGGGEEGWRYVGQTVIVLVAIFILYLISSLLLYASEQVSFLQWLGYLAWLVRLGLLILGVFATVLFAYTCDYLFVGPILNSTAQGGEVFQSFLNQVRKRLTVVLPILIALVALVIQLWP